jgi:hypothetical protein
MSQSINEIKKQNEELKRTNEILQAKLEEKSCQEDSIHPSSEEMNPMVKEAERKLKDMTFKTESPSSKRKARYNDFRCYLGRTTPSHQSELISKQSELSEEGSEIPQSEGPPKPEESPKKFRSPLRHRSEILTTYTPKTKLMKYPKRNCSLKQSFTSNFDSKINRTQTMSSKGSSS